MEDGSFYCYMPSGHQVPSWLPFGKTSGKSVLKRLGSLHDRNESDLISPSQASPARPASWHAKRSLSSSEQDHESNVLLPGAGITAQFGWAEVGGELYRLQPTIHAAKECVIVMSGYVYDVEQLQESAWSQHDAASNDSQESPRFDDMGSDPGSIAATILLQHILGCTRTDGGICDALAHVQGSYSLLVYDAEQRVAFAAASASGEETMFYFIDAEGAAHFSNLPLEVPGYPNTVSKWTELKPGTAVRIRSSKKKKAKVHVEVVTMASAKLHEAELSPCTTLPGLSSPTPVDRSASGLARTIPPVSTASSTTSDGEGAPEEDTTLFSLE